MFVGYTTDGDDLFTMPYPAAARPSRSPALRSRPPMTTRATQAAGAQRSATASAPVHGYSPLPHAEADVVVADCRDRRRSGARRAPRIGGCRRAGLSRGYAASATWLVSSPDGAPTPNAAARRTGRRYYRHDRWRPTFYAQRVQRHRRSSPGRRPTLGTPTAATRRERRSLQAGVLFLIRHARVAALGAAVGRSRGRRRHAGERHAVAASARRCAPRGRR